MTAIKQGMIWWILMLLASVATAQEWREYTPNEEKFLLCKDRIQVFQFGSKKMPAQYLGPMSFKEKSLGKLYGNICDLTMSSDGLIVIAKGSGTEPNMKLVYWQAPGDIETEVIPLTYEKFSKETTENQRRRNEENAILWFFAGQCAFNRNGELFITFGTCSGNGIFKVLTNSSTKLKRLNHCAPSISMQIPPWDSQHAYLAQGQTIWKLPLTVQPKEKNGGVPIFTLIGEKIFFGKTVMLSETQLITCINIPIDSVSANGLSNYNSFTIFIDQEKAGYWLLAEGQLGHTTLSQDGKTLLRHNSELHQLCEMELVK